MDRTIPRVSLEEGHARRAPLARGIGWGFIGGLVGTMVMDILLMGTFLAVGRPALLCFSVVGDTAARVFALTGAEIAGGVPAGVAAHYIIGPLVGLLFGAVAAAFPALRAGTLKKSIVLAVLYIEILSQPLLAMTPPLLKMTAPVVALWYGGSFVMHLVLGLVLGAIVGYGLRPAPSRHW